MLWSAKARLHAAKRTCRLRPTAKSPATGRESPVTSHQPPVTAFVILAPPARYPSGPRERSAKPPFVGSNPTRASIFPLSNQWSTTFASFPEAPTWEHWEQLERETAPDSQYAGVYLFCLRLQGNPSVATRCARWGTRWINCLNKDCERPFNARRHTSIRGYVQLAVSHPRA